MLIVVASLVGCGLLVVENGAEQVDSGWAVSTQPPITLDSKHTDPKQQIILNHVLQQIQVPLLQIPPGPQAPAATNGYEKAASTNQGSLRFAVRPDGVEGWRPIDQANVPLNNSLQPNIAAPQLNAPNNDNATPATDGAVNAEALTPDGDEADCGEHETGCGADEPLQWSSSSKGTATELPVADGEVPEQESIGELPEDDTAQEAPAEGDVAAPTLDPPATESVDETLEPSSDQPAEAESSSSDQADIGPISEDDTVAPAKKPTPPPPLTKQLVNLRSRVRSVLKGYYRKQLNSRENDPWEVMHGMLAYGVHSRIRQGGPRGAPVTTVGWLCYNKPCKNLSLMYVTPKGELRAKYGVGLQGHLGQLLAMLAQCRVSEEYPIRVGKREFTIKDLIEAEKKTCYPKSELTFKLIALQYYLDLNDTWVNDQGVDWDFPRMIREELAQPIRGAACGGTHRLSSLSLTVKARVRRGEPLDGEYARAAEFVQKYHRYAFGLQNRDGSLSTEWFRGRGDDSDINRRIKTTGHILEWLCYSLSDEELRQPKTIAAVTYLANLMYTKYDNEWEVGPMSHATHALLLYDERVFQPFDGEEYNASYDPKSRSAASTAKRVEVKTIRR